MTVKEKTVDLSKEIKQMCDEWGELFELLGK